MANATTLRRIAHLLVADLNENTLAKQENTQQN
jgi:hypothetical protein